MGSHGRRSRGVTFSRDRCGPTAVRGAERKYIKTRRIATAFPRCPDAIQICRADEHDDRDVHGVARLEHRPHLAPDDHPRPPWHDDDRRHLDHPWVCAGDGEPPPHDRPARGPIRPRPPVQLGVRDLHDWIGPVQPRPARHEPRPIPARPGREKLDPAGNLLFAGGLSLALLGVTLGAITGWAPLYLVLLLVGVACLFAFVPVERAVPSPMMDLALFRNKVFSAGVLSNL